MPTALPMWVGAFVLGVWMGDTLAIGLVAARVLLGLAGAGLALALVLDRLRGCALLGVAIALGALAQAARTPPLDPEVLGAQLAAALLPPESPVPPAPDTQWLCEGYVLADPVRLPDGTALRVAVTHVAALSTADPEEAPGTLELVAVRLALRVAITVRGEPAERLWPGDRVRVRAALRAPSGHDNPGAFDRLRHAAAVGLHASASVPPGALFRWADGAALPAGGPQTWAERADLVVLRAVARVRARALGALGDRLAAPRDALTAALVLGERGALARADRDRPSGAGIEADFRAAGIAHVLSVSGLHLSVVCWIFFWGLLYALRCLPVLTRRGAVQPLAAAIAIPATLGYALLTGAELATLRAAVAATLWLLAIVCGRRARLAEALAGAVLWIVAPWQAGTAGTAALRCFEPALQLSLAATLSIAYLRPLRALQPAAQHLLLRLGAWGRVPAAVLRVVDGTLAATAATTPLCAYYFAEIQGAGILGNLLAVPIGELAVLPAGLCALLLGGVATLPGRLCLAVAGFCADLMLRAASWLAGLGLFASVPAPGLGVLALWLCGLTCAVWRRRLGGGICAAALIAYLAAWAMPPGGLVWTSLDVGQGDAAVLELPRGEVIVIDAGPGEPAGARGTDAGSRIVGPFLHRRGHRRIDLLVASHPHPDHIGGLRSLLDQFEVGEVWALPPDAGSQHRDSPETERAWQDVLAGAARRGVRVVPPRDVQLGAVSIQILGPCREAGAGAGAGEEAGVCVPQAQAGWGVNDNSIALRVRYAGRALLFLGDAELAGELALLAGADAGRSLRADALKAPHHCSKTSSSESLVQAVSPAWVVCSLGRQNRFRFPHPAVVARYAQAGATVLRTDRAGAVTVAIEPSGKMRVARVRGSPSPVSP